MHFWDRGSAVIESNKDDIHGVGSGSIDSYEGIRRFPEGEP